MKNRRTPTRMISFRVFANRDLHIARAETLTPNAYSCVALAINCRAARLLMPATPLPEAVVVTPSKIGGDRSRSKAAVGIALHDRARGVGVCGRDIPVQLQHPARSDRRAAYREVGDGRTQPDAGRGAFCRGCCRLNTCAGRARRWRGERES